MAQQLDGKSLTNVPVSQTRPTRPSPDDVLNRVAASYGVQLNAVLSRSHREAYQTAVYLLRRAANEPLQSVAIRSQISPSRVSHIQQTIESHPLSPQQQIPFAMCKVKNCPHLSIAYDTSRPEQA